MEEASQEEDSPRKGVEVVRRGEDGEYVVRIEGEEQVFDRELVTQIGKIMGRKVDREEDSIDVILEYLNS